METTEENTAAEELAPVESKADLANIMQAMVFASADVVSLRKIRDILGDFIDISMVQEAMQLANDKLNSIDSPFEIVEQAGGFRFRTRNKYYPWVRQLFPETSARRLSPAALETLSVVAYKQPITRAEIESVRGVSCDGPLRNLLEKKLIALGERIDSPGNPYTYITTDEFLKYFGINRIPDDLPRLSEFKDVLNAGALLPQYKQGQVVRENQEDWDSTQVELSMGED
ncbi:MAG: SMC-Scp complex subunit ScpB [Fibrobacter sp.]|nr:SMC-Scp complex subunit ScpB [Fibrobacter sp.]